MYHKSRIRRVEEHFNLTITPSEETIRLARRVLEAKNRLPNSPKVEVTEEAILQLCETSKREMTFYERVNAARKKLQKSTVKFT